MDAMFRIVRAFCARTRNVAWKTSSASASLCNTLRQTSNTMLPWRRTSTWNAPSSCCAWNLPKSCPSVSSLARSFSTARRISRKIGLVAVSIVSQHRTGTKRYSANSSPRRAKRILFLLHDHARSTGFFLHAMPAEHFAYGFAAAHVLGQARPRLKERFYGCRIIARLLVPAVLRTVQGPVQRSTVEIGVGGL